MSRSALSGKVFAAYLFILGPVLIAVPNALLALFGIAPSSEVWIRVVGLLVCLLGVHIWIAARHAIRPLLQASVYTRTAVFIVLSTFALLGLSSPMLALFGVIDLLGAAWTCYALKSDAQAGKTVAAGRYPRT